jgi:carbonic anhydrase
VAAAIASKPKSDLDVATHVVQTWISDVRELYLQSNRTEIVEMREKNLATEAEGGTVPEPDIREPGFRALVEENVKLGVKRLSQSSIISNVRLFSLVLPACGDRD